MDPVKVLALARDARRRAAAHARRRLRAATRMTGEEDEIVAELSEPVRAALDAAERLVDELLDDLTDQRRRSRHEQDRRSRVRALAAAVAAAVAAQLPEIQRYLKIRSM